MFLFQFQFLDISVRLMVTFISSVSERSFLVSDGGPSLKIASIPFMSTVIFVVIFSVCVMFMDTTQVTTL